MLVDTKILSVIRNWLHTDLRLISKRLDRQRVNFTFHWNGLISWWIYDLDYVLLWTSRRSTDRPDMHNFIIRSDRHVAISIRYNEILRVRVTESGYSDSYRTRLSPLSYSLLFSYNAWLWIWFSYPQLKSCISQTEVHILLILNYFDMSRLIAWGRIRVDTWRQSWIRKKSVDKATAIRRDTSWSRVIYEWRHPSVVTTFLRLSLSLSLKSISHHLDLDPFDVSSVIRFLFYYVLSYADCKSYLFRSILITRSLVDENDDDLL